MPVQAFSGLGSLAAQAGQRVDKFFTNYLANTTTDQEILDYYGDGNIVGRKGIPNSDKELLDVIESSNKNYGQSLRPQADRPRFSVGGIDQTINYQYSTDNIPNLNNPTTGRPWQMTFGKLPVDFGSSMLTPAAKQFLEDFRVPVNSGNDYSFATGPNIQDRIEFQIADKIANDPDQGRSPQKLQESLDAIRKQDSFIGEYGGRLMTPRDWQEQGYISQKPNNFKAAVFDDFKNRIIKDQGPFSSVSTLTPVADWDSSKPNWRAEAYEIEGLAGPISNQNARSGYGTISKDVQRFTPGKDRLLPLQPYTEFFDRLDSTPVSFKGVDPAPDFTPLQKSVGTRNYLIGRNILDGRGSLGFPVRATRAGLGLTTDVTASIPLFDPEFRRAVERGDNWGAAKQVARDYIAGAVATPIVGAAVTGAQRIAPRAAAAVLPVVAGVTRIANPVAVVSQIGGDSKQTQAQIVADRQAAEAQRNRARQAQQRGGQWRIGSWRIPDLGISESGGVFAGGNSSGRRIGSKSILNGKPVVWTGDAYGWQSPRSAAKVGVQ